MLPRRHILDVIEFVKDEDDILAMSTITLAIDAVKYMEPKSRRDHLVEALELNEFICFMFPLKRPQNRSLLFHVVSDLLGLLLYGVPKKSKQALENLESINYSEKNMEAYPVIEVWDAMKDNVYSKKHGAISIIDGFVKKIRVEMDIAERYPFVEDIFDKSKEYISEWLPALSRYYDKRTKTIKSTYDKWWSVWLCDERKDIMLSGMIDRLYVQAETEYGVTIDKESIFSSISLDKDANRKENERFSALYKKGINLLLKI
ncbi:MAG: hypothetical protein NT178_10230 [Proteobacteria bacterium]|nr:hypothetical protein [Pseudomonadota bacterium]